MFNIISRMIHGGILTEPRPVPDAADTGTAQQELWKVLGRALAIRQVDAGSCNGCELEIHALNNPYYNLEGVGIKFVASPRHADLLLVTGPVSVNMAEALRRTLRRNARAETGGGTGRLRRVRRSLRAQLRELWRRRRRHSGGLHYPWLSTGSGCHPRRNSARDQDATVGRLAPAPQRLRAQAH